MGNYQQIYDEVRQEAGREERRRHILDVLILRFDPAASAYREIEKLIIKIKDDELLYRLFATSVKANTFTDFQTIFQEVVAPVEKGPA